MEKAIKVIEYLENEFSLELSHLQKVDLEHILTKKTDSKELFLSSVSNRRELLIAYEIKMSSCSDEQAEIKVDSYLASISN